MPAQMSGRWIRHPRDTLNLLRSVTAPVLVFYPYFGNFDLCAGILYALFLFAVVGDANYLLHLHVHRPFMQQGLLNRIIDILLGFSTGMTSANWRIQHVYGHHISQDAAFRVRAEWPLQKFSITGAIWFSAGSIPKTFFGPILDAFRKGFVSRIDGPMNYREAFLEQVALIVFVTLLGFISPRITLCYLVPWYGVTFFISRYVDYLNHYGCDEADPRPHADANTTTHRLFNFTTHNFGYHAAHHLRPAAHWSELPEIHARIAAEIPPERLKSFSWSFLWLPNHFVRSLLKRM